MVALEVVIAVGEEDESISRALRTNLTAMLSRNHCINIVTFDGQKYLVDVGMGPTAPSQPVLLKDGNTVNGIGSSKCRVRWDTIPAYTDPDCKLWIFEQDNGGKSDFIPTYCFSELEFLPQDYEIMKNGTTFNRKSWFTYRVVCVRTVLDEETEDVIGCLMLINDSLKKRINGKTENLATFKNENERVAALKEWFGIEMSDEDQNGIRGLVTDLGRSGESSLIN
jgi:arylamine N-acetyltransferase